MTKDAITPELILAIEKRVEHCHYNWNLVDPRELILVCYEELKKEVTAEEHRSAGS